MLLNFLMLLKFLENQGMSIYQKGSVVADMCNPNTGKLSTFVKSSHENTCHIKSASSETHNNFFQAQNTHIWLGKAPQIKGATRKITTLLNWFKMHQDKKDFSGEQASKFDLWKHKNMGRIFYSL